MTNNLSIGTVVSWQSPEGDVDRSALLQAVVNQGIPAEIVRDMAWRSAFLRAAKDLISKSELVRKVEEDDHTITFQFTREHKESGRLRYSEKAIFYLNKKTGDIRSTDDEARRAVDKLVHEHMEKRSTADVTRLIQQIFEKFGGDLVPLRQQGGVYFVPESNRDILARVGGIMNEIGGQLNTYTVNGDASTKGSVASDMAKHLRSMIDEFKKSCDGLDMNSKEHVLRRREQTMQHLKTKLTSYNDLLEGFQQEINREMQAAYADFVAKTTGQTVAPSVTPPVQPVPVAPAPTVGYMPPPPPPPRAASVGGPVAPTFPMPPQRERRLA